jgi:hypothetical protein
MYRSHNKIDLMIEVWELLDCENVGAAEIIAIETAVRERFGEQAVASPMVIARLLADEGAELRHSEIMELHVERSAETVYDAALRNIIDISGLGPAASSIKQLENLRRKYAGDGDVEGLRLMRERAVDAKEEALQLAGDRRELAESRQMYAEIAEWFTIWLRSPEVFENWLTVRRSSKDYISKFVEPNKAMGK